jgi:hypothetical protein
MHPARSPRPKRFVTAGLFTGLVSAAIVGQAESGFTVRLDLVDGSSRRGTLVRIDADAVTLAAVAGERETAVPIAQVRRLGRDVAAAEPPRALVALTDGGTIAADAFAWSGAAARVELGSRHAEIPIGLVRHVVWREPGATAPPAWLAAVPERLESDLVVVGSGTGFECVPCAIESVTADSVTVVLDGETIPVKRSKVLGLVWLREAVAARGAKLSIPGGSLRSGRVEWTTDGLVLDGPMRLPADWLVGIDFAAGRTTRLADLLAEKTNVEPLAPGLAAEAGLAAFFAPRILRSAGADGPADLLLRPRTVAVWRVPPASRRFRASLAAAAWAAPSGCSAVAVALDGREVARALVGAGAGPSAPTFDVDVSEARRLTLTIEFATEGDVGCPVRLGDPVFEQ